MRGALHILDDSGHRTLEWDTEQEDEALDPAYVEAEFDRLVAGGFLGFGTTEQNESVHLRRGEFDPVTYPKIVVHRQLGGG